MLRRCNSAPASLRLHSLTASTSASQLAGFLNQYFSQLVRIIHRNGGDVMKFAGDAMIVIWPNESSAAPCLNCSLAAASAHHPYPVTPASAGPAAPPAFLRPRGETWPTALTRRPSPLRAASGSVARGSPPRHPMSGDEGDLASMVRRAAQCGQQIQETMHAAELARSAVAQVLLFPARVGS